MAKLGHFITDYRADTDSTFTGAQGRPSQPSAGPAHTPPSVLLSKLPLLLENLEDFSRHLFSQVSAAFLGEMYVAGPDEDLRQLQ